VHQAQLETGLPRGQLEARQRVDGGHVGTQPADVAGELLHRERRRPGRLELIEVRDEFCDRRASQ
jgi:hypothetical protein